NTRRIQRVGALPEHTSLRALSWSDSETLLATLSKAGASRFPAHFGGGYSLTVAMSPTGDGVVMLPAPKGNPAAADWAVDALLVRSAITKPHTVIMSIGSQLFEVDTITGKPL